MKQFAAILFLGVLAFCRLASFFIDVDRTNEGRELTEAHFLQSLSESDCTAFNLADIEHNLRWAEHGKAFFLDGIMYDIAKVKITQQKIMLYAILETKESEILSHHSMNPQEPGSNSAGIFNAVISDHVLPETAQTYSPTISTKNIFFSYSDMLSNTWGNILLPPPRPLSA